VADEGALVEGREVGAQKVVSYAIVSAAKVKTMFIQNILCLANIEPILDHFNEKT